MIKFLFALTLIFAASPAAAEDPPVQAFDIAGFTLRTTYKDAMNMIENGNLFYQLKSEEQVIPELFRYNYDSECRGQGIVVPRSIESCIQSLAEENGTKYIGKVFLVRPETNEEIVLHFTSPHQFNSIYKIVYTNPASKTIGEGKHFEYQKQLQLTRFWAKVLNKYGKPNAGENLWKNLSLRDASPYLKYSHSGLILHSPYMEAKDKEENEKAAKASFKPLPLDF